MNNNKRNGAIVCILAVLMLAGCGEAKVPEVVSDTSLAVANDGTVTSYLVDKFDKEYYSISDLTAMAVGEAAEYNTEHQSGETIPLKVEKVEALSDGSNKVVVTHKYNSTETYEDYNEAVLFYGTVTEAVNAGYQMDIILKGVKDGAIYTEEQLLQNADKHLLITDAKAVIYCPKRVAYISDGAVYHEDGSVDASQAEGIVFLLMK